MRKHNCLSHLFVTVAALLLDTLKFIVLAFRSRPALMAENLFLRKQLALYLEREVKPRRASDATRLTMVFLSKLFPWRKALASFKPQTFLHWHRQGYGLLWRWKSRPRGRPRISVDLGRPSCKALRRLRSGDTRMTTRQVIHKNVYLYSGERS